jgi:hypothetical protein
MIFVLEQASWALSGWTHCDTLGGPALSATVLAAGGEDWCGGSVRKINVSIYSCLACYVLMKKKKMKKEKPPKNIDAGAEKRHFPNHH